MLSIYGLFRNENDMRVLITDNTHPVLCQKLTAAGAEVVVDDSHTYESLLRCVDDFDALVVRSKIIIDAPFIDCCSRLKCIGRVGAGMETIDVDYAESKGIRCLNSPEGNRDAVGEHAVALLLALMAKVVVADAEVRRGLWQREANRGVELMGKTVGIVGMGNMGGAFARRLAGFGCRVLAYDLLGDKASGFAQAPFAESVSLQQLQHECDVVSLHVPLTPATRYLVDGTFLGAFAKPFYLINTARGAVVHTPSLVDALERGLVLGAGIDVMEYEDMTKDGLSEAMRHDDFRYLQQSPRVVLTPHVGGWTVESKYKLAAVLADKIAASLGLS